jgi:hypothetical protein
VADWVKELDRTVSKPTGPITEAEVHAFVVELGTWGEMACEAKHILVQTGRVTEPCSVVVVWRAHRAIPVVGCLTDFNVCENFRSMYHFQVARREVKDDLVFRKV